MLSPNAPDLSRFPRRLWLRATAEATRDLPDTELDYPADSRGAVNLRTALVGYLSRVRRVRVDLDNLILTLGFLHSLDLLFRGFVLRGVRRVAVENPSIPEQIAIARAHGMEVQPIVVDEAGLVVADLLDTDAEVVIVTPAHQFPLGTVLSPERRRALAAWVTARDALIIENDYAAEFRYDGPPIGAVQGLAPERTVYVGTTSKTLAPAVRLGWIAAPPRSPAPSRTRNSRAAAALPASMGTCSPGCCCRAATSGTSSAAGATTGVDAMRWSRQSRRSCPGCEYSASPAVS